jgi:predicted transcriptional regulator
MARKKSPTLTDAELRFMRILWDLRQGTVNDVVEALPPDEPLAYSTVLTTLRILEEKGYIRHEKSGRAFVYEPVVQPSEARKDALQYVLDRFFNNSPELLLANVMEDENLTLDDLKEIHSLLAERRPNSDEAAGESQPPS